MPLDWMARHPGWVKFPATLVPRRPAARAGTDTQARPRPTTPIAIPNMDTATLGMTATATAAIPGVLDGHGLAAAAVPEVVLAPVLVLVLIVSAAGALVWRTMTREQARLLHAHPAAPLATPLPPPLPANPGLVPPPIAPDRPADAGTPQAPPIPDLPGLPQTDPVPDILSTPASDQGGPTIFRTDRNKGLEGGGENTLLARSEGRQGCGPGRHPSVEEYRVGGPPFVCGGSRKTLSAACRGSRAGGLAHGRALEHGRPSRLAGRAKEARRGRHGQARSRQQASPMERAGESGCPRDRGQPCKFKTCRRIG